jgi:hypothetical protein
MARPGEPSSSTAPGRSNNEAPAAADLASLLQPATEKAADMLAAAKGQKVRDVAAMNQQRDKLQSDAAMEMLRLWLERLETDDAAIRSAEHRVQRLQDIVERVGGPARLRISAAEQVAEAERLAEAVRDAQERMLAARAVARSSQQIASKAKADIVRKGTWAETETAARALAAQSSQRPPESGTAAGTCTSIVKAPAAAPAAAPPPAAARRASTVRQGPHVLGMHALDDSPDEKEVQGPSGKVYAGTSFFTLRPGHQPRKFFIQIAESKPFDPLILLTIMANCSSMAWESPLDPEGTPKAQCVHAAPATLASSARCGGPLRRHAPC